MKKVFSKFEYIAMIIIIVLSFFPWIGILNRSAVDITTSVIENITSVAAVDSYAITLTFVLAVLALIMALMNKGKELHTTIAFIAPIVAFVYGMIDTSGDYLSSMELAYIIVVLLSALMLLKQFGIIKLKFLK